MKPAAGWPLAAVVFAAPWALGGTRPAAQVALAAAVALAVGWRFAAGGGWRWPAVLWLPFVPAGWGVVQLAAGITRDPPATVIATLHQLAFALVVIAAASVEPDERRRLRRVIATSAAAVAALGLVQWITGADRFFGLIAPLDRPALGGYFATFVNPNTLAGFLVLGAAVALGWFVESGRRGALAAAVLAAGGAVLSGSRGGQVALVLAAAVFAALARRGAGRGVGLGALGFVALAVGAAVVLLPDWGADPGLDGRVAIGRASLGCLAEHALGGSGRGTFAVVFTACQQAPLPGTVTHPETIALQLAIEWGVPVALVALGGGLAAGALALRRAGTHPGRWGLCAGLVAVGAQQLVDFGFEAMGLSLPVAAALGLALADGPERPRAVPAVAAALLALGSIAGLWAARHTADADAARVLAATTPAAIEAAAAEATARHPADAHLQFVAAARLAETGGRLDAIVRHLDRAMSLAPVDGRPHRLAARVMRAAGREAQAAAEYRRAFAELPWLRGALVREVATLAAPTQMAAATPPEARAALGEVLLAAGRAGEARAAMEAALLVDPGEADAHRLRGRACLALADAPCAAEAAAWLEAAGEAVAAHGLRARAALAAGDHDGARAAVAAAEAAGDTTAALRLRAEVAGALGELDVARAAYDALWRRVAARPAEAAAVLAAWGRLEKHAGDPERGRRMLRQAAALDPQHAAEATE
ncbi:MAG: hypothetical protein R3F65_08855 [bacterium]